MAKYNAVVFGKGHGCSKCTVLKSRLSKLLEDPKYADVEMKFNDILTEEGMVKFLQAEVLNPNRIPAVLMQEADTGEYVMLPETRDLNDESATGLLLGVQTDYNNGGGVISPQMLQRMLDMALR